jgi:hypothetical protein
MAKKVALLAGEPSMTTLETIHLDFKNSDEYQGGMVISSIGNRSWDLTAEPKGVCGFRVQVFTGSLALTKRFHGLAMSDACLGPFLKSLVLLLNKPTQTQLTKRLKRAVDPVAEAQSCGTISAVYPEATHFNWDIMSESACGDIAKLFGQCYQTNRQI